MVSEITDISKYPGFTTTTSAIHDFIKKSPIQDLVNWGPKNSLWFMTQPMGCCGIEIICTAGGPHYDADRFGIIPRSSPRQADVLLISGWISAKYLPALKLLYEQMLEPKWVVAMGECSMSGGPFWEAYSTVINIEKIFPVDVFIPGCPPRPEQLLKGFLELQQKITKKLDRTQVDEDQWDKQQWEGYKGVFEAPYPKGKGLAELDIPPSQMLLHLGPQHPLQPGPFLLDLTIEGERVREASLTMGFNHRSLEKILENRMYLQCIPLTDRICYLASISNNEAFCAGVEALMGIEPPLRAQYIRTIMMELSRLQSHMLGLGEYATDLGYLSMFLYMVRERESVISLIESVTGSRLNHTFVRVGGVAADLPAGFRNKALTTLKGLKRRIVENDELMIFDSVYLKRTLDVGVLSTEAARELGVAGPVLRASHVNYDIRKVESHLIYPELDFKVVSRREGDVFARVKVRLDEMLDLIIPPAGEVYSRMEDPRGEMGMFIVSDGTHRPYRMKIRGPAYATLQALPPLLEGVYVADVAAIAASMDSCISEVDR